MYQIHNGKKLAKKVKKEIEFEEEYKKEVKEFSLLDYLYGRKQDDLR